MSPWVEAFLDLLFPRQYVCLLCHEPTADGVCVCETCLRNMPFLVGPGCRVCGGPLGDKEAICTACVGKTVAYDDCFAAALYDDCVRQAVFQFKYSKQRDLGDPLGRLLVDQLRQRSVLPHVDVILPVPLSRQRLAQRGFNQAEELARPLSHAVHAPLITDVLIRSQDTKPQWQLGPGERSDNVGHAFMVQHAEGICGRAVAVVDDIYTTGATSQACADVLKQAGAARVVMVTFATVQRHRG